MDNPIGELPQYVQDYLQKKWREGVGDKELYGFRWKGKTFMAKHPQAPMFLDDYTTDSPSGLSLIVGPTGAGVTLVTHTATIDEREETAIKTRDFIADKCVDPAYSNYVRTLDVTECWRASK